MDGREMSSSDGDMLDNTLLESLFYNEMMLMEESPSLLLSILSADGTPAVDANTMAETALLGEFGVAGEPARSGWHGSSGTNHSHSQRACEQQQSILMPSGLPCPSLVPTATTTVQHYNQMTATPASSINLGNTVLASNAVAMTPQTVPSNSFRETRAVDSLSSAPAAEEVAESEKRKKLVSQFATLASRLGIQLPPQVLLSTQLTSGSQSPVPTTAPFTDITIATIAAAAAESQENTQPSPNQVLSPSSSFSSLQLPPKVQELQNTAEAAIAAVARKRPFEEASVSSNTNVNNNPNSNISAKNYAKRRKKPSLVECERKLASLEAENALLKRHLNNINNQSDQFLKEQLAASEHIRHLWKSNASEEELDSAVTNLTDLYADYGKRRQDELSFHLEQLYRLANPTNVTKMGLWALGQQSVMKRNPIAGMLQKELGITAQQGRKILEQREKIRHVSSNLKECLDLLGKLQTLCERKTKIFHERMSKCREILTPRQVVKLILWIGNHSEVLDRVCPGWGSEHIRS